MFMFKNGDQFWPSFIYGTNSGPTRLELKQLSRLWRSRPKMVIRVIRVSEPEHILSRGTEPSQSQGEQCHVGVVLKRKFRVPRFVAQNREFRVVGGRCRLAVPRDCGVETSKLPSCEVALRLILSRSLSHPG